MAVLRALRLVVLAGLLIVFAGSSVAASEHERSAQRTADYDIVVYGGTSGGVIAAIQAQRLGRRAVLVAPSGRLGGLTSGGLGATDIGNKTAIGGLSREFYRRVFRYYQDEGAWKFEEPGDYQSRRQRPGEDTMWTFEPHVAEHLFEEWVDEAGVRVIRDALLETSGVAIEDGRIRAIVLDNGMVLEGRQFIDATYEGDLLAAAGVSFHVGREANAVYDETLNGVQTANAVHHQMQPGVDPYVVAGDPSSGLLPGLHAGPPGEEGGGDHREQAYNFRMCLTDVDENRIPFAKPPGYDPLRYELLLRDFEAGLDRIPWSPTMMPNRKTDTNNNLGFSTDNIGMNYDWPEGDAATREEIFRDHLLYQQGLMWTLANHPRVPGEIRREVSRWGLCRDEFTETGGWPHQLYVREGRRMISDYVMTQHDCQGRRMAEDPVGLAAYTMDSHNVQRYVDEHGHARNEGDVQVGGFAPYPISFRSIVPKRSECTNLSVPVCLSASHIAYGSIRMEPVFMVLGQSAATAASLAIEQDVDVQSIDYPTLQRQLIEDDQVLEWTGPRPATGIDPARLEGVVSDDPPVEDRRGWLPSRSVGGFVGAQYWHDNNDGKGRLVFRHTIALSEPGRYEVRVYYTAHANRATNVPVTVRHADGADRLELNQRQEPPGDEAYASLGVYRFLATEEAVIEIGNEGTDGYVVADAVQLVPVSSSENGRNNR